MTPPPSRRSPDEPVLKVLATLQLLLCCAGLPLFVLSFNYGGASVWPQVFAGGLLYFAFGFASALLLYIPGVPGRRVMSFLWHALLSAFGIYLISRGMRSAWFLVPLPSTLYLGGSSLVAFVVLARRDPRSAWRVLLATCIATVIAVATGALYYWSWHDARALRWRLRSPDADTRCAAARRLGRIGPPVADTLPALKAMLDDTSCHDSGEFADRTIDDIVAIGGIDPVFDVMKTGGAWGRQIAAGYLRFRVHDYPQRVAELKSAFAAGLADEDALVRQFSVEGLGELAAVELLPRIRALADDKSPQVRDSVKVVVEKLDR